MCFCFNQRTSSAPDQHVYHSLPTNYTLSKGREFCAASHLPASDVKIMDDTLIFEALIWDDVIFVDPLAATAVDPGVIWRLLSYLGIDKEKGESILPTDPLE